MVATTVDTRPSRICSGGLGCSNVARYEATLSVAVILAGAWSLENVVREEIYVLSIRGRKACETFCCVVQSAGFAGTGQEEVAASELQNSPTTNTNVASTKATLIGNLHATKQLLVLSLGRAAGDP